MDAVVDKQEQYSRRNCLLIHGIVEETAKDTASTHYRKIINTLQIKFTRYNTHNRIYRNKKKLKGTGISMMESLTAMRMQEKSRLLTMCGHKMARLIFSVKIQTKLKFIIVNFCFFF